MQCEPAHMILVLVPHSSSESSDEPAHSCIKAVPKI